MKDYKIGIVNSSSFGMHFPEHFTRLEKIGQVKRFAFPDDIDGASLAKELQGYNIIISSVTPHFTKEFFDHKDELLLISRHGIGYNNIDLQAAKEHGCLVAIVPPLVERDAVAENAVANLMAVIRQTVPATEAVKADRWGKRADFMGINITGKTVGVIGCGNIGSRVAEILKYGFNTRLLVTDPDIDDRWLQQHQAELVDLDSLLKESDIISLNARLNLSSKNILDDDTFEKMKKGVYITNTARGALVDEDAMLRAIEQGIVSGFATDVMVSEPAFSDHPYVKNKKILVTPHSSAYTFECLEGMGEKCVDDVEKVVDGVLPEMLVSE